MKRATQRPLIEEAEGRDADRRSDLIAAWNRCKLWRSRTSTNLHVREFLLWIFALDQKGDGATLRKSDIADRLETSERSALLVVSRAEREFRLIEVIEQRFINGGQRANRYRIDWATVRAINSGELDRAAFNHRPTENRTPPYRNMHAGVPKHACRGVKIGRAYKEVTSIKPESNQSSPSNPPLPNVTPDVATCTAPGASWEKVEEEVSLVLGDWKNAVRAAQRNGVTPDHALAIVEHWRTLGPSVAPGALYHRLRNCRPNVAPDVGWPASRPTSSAPRPAQAGAIRADPTVKANCIISGWIKAGRRDAIPQDQIDARIRHDLSAAGLDPEKYYPEREGDHLTR